MRNPEVSRISLSRAAVMRPDARTGFRNFLVAVPLPLHIQSTGLRKVTTDTRTEGRVKRSLCIRRLVYPRREMLRSKDGRSCLVSLCFRRSFGERVSDSASQRFRIDSKTYNLDSKSLISETISETLVRKLSVSSNNTPNDYPFHLYLSN